MIDSSFTKRAGAILADSWARHWPKWLPVKDEAGRRSGQTLTTFMDEALGQVRNVHNLLRTDDPEGEVIGIMTCLLLGKM